MSNLDPKKYVKECSSAHVSFQRFSDTLHACFTHFARIVLLVFVYKSSVDCKSKRMVWVCLRTATEETWIQLHFLGQKENHGYFGVDR